MDTRDHNPSRQYRLTKKVSPFEVRPASIARILASRMIQEMALQVLLTKINTLNMIRNMHSAFSPALVKLRPHPLFSQTNLLPSFLPKSFLLRPRGMEL
jgi:hypothetical protein